jgi:uncharacterized protein (DUF983 family)
MSFIEEALDEPGFWILGGGGVGMVILGWIISRGMEYSLPLWQLIALIITILLASAYFSTKD